MSYVVFSLREKFKRYEEYERTLFVPPLCDLCASVLMLPMNDLEIDLDACRGRQRRLLQGMQELQIDLAVVTRPEHVQYLAGPRFPWLLCSAAALSSEGILTLVAPQKEPELAAADEVLTYEAKWHSTLRNDQPQACAEVLGRAVQRQVRGRNLGVEFSAFGHYASLQPGQLIDLEPHLFTLRRRKDADELARLRTAIAATGRMYQRARELVEPGVSEIHLFNELQSAAVEFCGEMLTGTGNDYQCNSRGGPPRHDRVAAAGELYILDLGPAFRGYFADTARTLAVSQPTDQQQQAWQHVVQVFDLVASNVRPGKSARELFNEAQSILDQAPLGVFNHHLGHGIGLFPHEAPHLNPHWADTFQEGDVFTVEPGLYAPELAAGLRLENDYLVTADGVELLSDFPLALK